MRRGAFLILLFLFKTGSLIAQAPHISYQSPQTYFVGTPITPLLPVNTGGSVPANTYGLVYTVAGNSIPGNVNGAALNAEFNTPVGVIFDAAGNLYVSEYGNNDIRKIDPSGNVTTYAGTGTAGIVNGPANQATFSSPYQMAFDAAGNLYVADAANNYIREISTAGIVSNFAGSGNQGNTNGTAHQAQFYNPIGLTFDPSGNMYVADRGNNAIRKIDVSGNVTTLLVVNGAGAPIYDDLGLDFLTTNSAGNIYFTNTNQEEISTPAGAITSIAGNPGYHGYADGSGGAALFFGLVGIALDLGNDAYVADDGNDDIRRVSANGVAGTVAGDLGAGSIDGIASAASFNAPNGVTIDHTGNFLYVADAGNNLIRKVGITGYSINKTLPSGLTFDPATGEISGTPAFAPPTDVYTITAYNQYGSSSYPVTIQIVDDRLTFPVIPVKTVCDADFNPGATGTGTIMYSSSNASVATIVAGQVHITGAGKAVITATNGASQAQDTLTVNPAATPAITITPGAPDTCQGKPVIFLASVTNGGAQPAFQWQVNGQNQGADNPQFSTDGLNNGDKITCTLTSNDTCITTTTVISNTAVFSVEPPAATSVSISSSSAAGLVCAGTPVTFTATVYSPDVSPGYQWQVNGKNAGTNKAEFTADNFKSGDVVSCTVATTGKCIIDSLAVSNTITVTLSPQSQCVVTVPNTFTPNGDGINDLWDISKLQAYPGCTVSIYNRSGEMIYKSINYPRPWDGTYNGKQLPVGTYYYVIDLKNGQKPLAGAITLLR